MSGNKNTEAKAPPVIIAQHSKRVVQLLPDGPFFIGRRGGPHGRPCPHTPLRKALKAGNALKIVRALLSLVIYCYNTARAVGASAWLART
jgi:hypothetical protein